jgi:hypothetical protein
MIWNGISFFRLQSSLQGKYPDGARMLILPAGQTSKYEASRGAAAGRKSGLSFNNAGAVAFYPSRQMQAKQQRMRARATIHMLCSRAKAAFHSFHRHKLQMYTWRSLLLLHEEWISFSIEIPCVQLTGKWAISAQ